MHRHNGIDWNLSENSTGHTEGCPYCRIEELEHAINDVEITLCNDRHDERIDNALATLRGVMGEDS